MLVPRQQRAGLCRVRRDRVGRRVAGRVVHVAWLISAAAPLHHVPGDGHAAKHAVHDRARDWPRRVSSWSPSVMPLGTSGGSSGALGATGTRVAWHVWDCAPEDLRGFADVDPQAEDGDALGGPCSVAWHRASLESGEDGVGVGRDVLERPEFEGEAHGIAVAVANQRLARRAHRDVGDGHEVGSVEVGARRPGTRRPNEQVALS